MDEEVDNSLSDEHGLRGDDGVEAGNDVRNGIEQDIDHFPVGCDDEDGAGAPDDQRNSHHVPGPILECLRGLCERQTPERAGNQTEGKKKGGDLGDIPSVLQNAVHKKDECQEKRAEHQAVRHRQPLFLSFLRLRLLS